MPEVGQIDTQQVLKLIEERSRELCDVVAALDQAMLDRPARAPGWSRLNVLCHLRYGAVASHQITDATLAGRAASFYPGGRDLQRPYTLEPALGEPPLHVVPSLRDECAGLLGTWRGLAAPSWELPVAGDEDDPTGACNTLRDLAVLRLVELMRHGDDLDLDLSPPPPALHTEHHPPCP